MKTTDKISKLIKKNNALMAKASKAEKRVIIAKDALDQIRKAKFTPMSRNWCVIDDSLISVDGTCSAQPTVLGDDFRCKGCALGSLFISSIRLRNNETINNLLNASWGLDAMIRNDETELNKIFSKKQLTLIERTFEFGRGGFGRSESDKESVDIYNFYMEYPEDTDRLVAILNNIVKNKGTFVLPIGK